MLRLATGLRIMTVRAQCSLCAATHNEHYHTGLALLHPVDVHYGRVDAIVAARQRVLDDAHRRHPERFVRGLPTQKAPPAVAWINPPPMDVIAGADPATPTGPHEEVAVR